MDDFPLIGDREASRPIVEIFDYTCPQCRELHGMLQQAHAEFGNELAVVLVPVPLDPKCNRYATVKHEEHATACELTRIALAVWQAKPEAFEQFHHHMMQGKNPPSPAEAEAAAVKLLGEETFHKTLANPAVEERLQGNCEIYGKIRQSTGESALPKLIYGHTASSGLPSGMDELRRLLDTFHKAATVGRGESE
jgi:protein-disulfide isomerase